MIMVRALMGMATAARRLNRPLPLAALLLVVLLATPALGSPAPSPAGGPAPQAVSSDGIFPETGYRIGDPRFQAYFASLGGIRTFGYPTSRPFSLLGTRVQFFQRHVMQVRPDGAVGLLNLLDEGILPYTDFGNATVPLHDPAIASAAPGPATPDYGLAVAGHIAAYVPNEWQGMPVGFRDAFLLPGQLVGEADPTRQALIGLELLGFPTSEPAADPNNSLFVYQRFQRGVVHFDATTGLAQPLLLADYLKAVMTGQNLPPALEAQAAVSRFYRQYTAGMPMWLARPDALVGSDLTAAFEPDDPALAGTAGAAGAQARTAPAVIPPEALAASVAPNFFPTPTPNPFEFFPTETPAAAAQFAQPTAAAATAIPGSPHIDGIEPGSAEVGQDVIIRGRSFGTEPGHVFFSGKVTTAQVWSDTSVIVTVPAGAANGSVSVRRADGVFSNSVGFDPLITPSPTVPETPTLSPTPSLTPTPAAPVLTSVEPHWGIAGRDSVLLIGTAFGPSTGIVLMGAVEAPVSQAGGWSETSIVVAVPAQITNNQTVRVLVRRATDGAISNHRCFTIVQPTATPPVVFGAESDARFLVPLVAAAAPDQQGSGIPTIPPVVFPSPVPTNTHTPAPPTKTMTPTVTPSPTATPSATATSPAAAATHTATHSPSATVPTSTVSTAQFHTPVPVTSC
jgi:hypothetical protein